MQSSIIHLICAILVSSLKLYQSTDDFVEVKAESRMTDAFVEVKAEAWSNRPAQQIRYNPQRRPSVANNNNGKQGTAGAKWWCPDANEIYPCTCDGPQSFVLITCDRLANTYSLYQAFRTHYPTTEIGKLSVTNSRIEKLNEGAFGKLRVEYIYLKKNTLKTLELDVLLPSRASLKRLEIIHNDLDKFPFANMSSFPKLEYLDLHYNSLKTIPDFAFGPNDKLREINLSFNKISYVGSFAFERLYALERLNLRFNKLAVLNNDAFALARPNPKLHLDLSNNQMVLVSDGAFNNQYPLLLNLSSNALKSFPQAHFKPVLNGMALAESGCVETYDNRFRCTCSNVGWLVRLPEDLKSRVVGFYCTDVGKTLENLRLYDINCPY